MTISENDIQSLQEKVNRATSEAENARRELNGAEIQFSQQIHEESKPDYR